MAVEVKTRLDEDPLDSFTDDQAKRLWRAGRSLGARIGRFGRSACQGGPIGPSGHLASERVLINEHRDVGADHDASRPGANGGGGRARARGRSRGGPRPRRPTPRIQGSGTASVQRTAARATRSLRQDRPQHQSDGSRYRTDDEQDVYAVLFVRAEGVEAHGERVPGTCRHLGHRSWWLVPSAVPSGP